MEKAAIIRGLTKQYSNGRGIFDIDLEINQGDVFGLFGPNGAGKTTLMKCITGLAGFDKGSVSFFGYDLLSDFKNALGQVGCVVGSATAFNHMDAVQNLTIAARICGNVPYARIEEVLELVGLDAYKKERVASYSMGMKQRLGLANALLSKPRLLILDEPTNGLDIDGKLLFHKIVSDLSQHKKMSFLISSHLLLEMERLCNRFGFILDGELNTVGSMESLNGHCTLEQYYIDRSGGSRL